MPDIGELRSNILNVVANGEVLDKVTRFSETTDYIENKKDVKSFNNRRATCMPKSSFLHRGSKEQEILISEKTEVLQRGSFSHTKAGLIESTRVPSRLSIVGSINQTSQPHSMVCKPSSLKTNRFSSNDAELSHDFKRINVLDLATVEDRSCRSDTETDKGSRISPKTSTQKKISNEKGQVQKAKNNTATSSRAERHATLRKKIPMEQEKQYQVRQIHKKNTFMNRTADNSFKATDQARESSYSHNKRRIIRDDPYFAIDPALHKQLLKELAKNKLYHQPAWRNSPFMK